MGGRTHMELALSAGGHSTGDRQDDKDSGSKKKVVEGQQCPASHLSKEDGSGGQPLLTGPKLEVQQNLLTRHKSRKEKRLALGDQSNKEAYIIQSTSSVEHQGIVRPPSVSHPGVLASLAQPGSADRSPGSVDMSPRVALPGDVDWSPGAYGVVLPGGGRSPGHDYVSSDRKSAEPPGSNSRTDSVSPSSSESSSNPIYHLWNFDWCMSHRSWLARQYKQLLANYFFRCSTWMLGLILNWILTSTIALMIGYSMFYITWVLLAIVLSRIPVIGPLALGVMRFFEGLLLNLFPQGPTATGTDTAWHLSFWKFNPWSYFSSTSSNNITGLGTLSPPIGFDGIDNAINATRRLSQLGLHMLPISAILRYSSMSLIGAGDIISSSNVYERVKLMKAYENLQNDTSILASTLASYDSKAKNMIYETEWRLDTTLSHIETLISDLNFTPWSTYIFPLSTVGLIACIGAPFLAHPISPRPASCAASIIASAHSYCLASSGSSSGNYPWCPSILTIYSTNPSNAESAILTDKAEGITVEFYKLFDTLDLYIKELLDIAELALEKSNSVSDQYSQANRIRLEGHSIVAIEINAMQIKAAETPSWAGWLKGQKSAGLPLKDKFHLASLERQEFNLKQLKAAHHSAHTSLTIAIGILEDLKSKQEDMMRGVQGVRLLGRSGEREWSVLIGEIKRMRPLVVELATLGNYANRESTRLRQEWRRKFSDCIEEEKAKETREWSGWEDCFFKGLRGGD
ncbi:uncharacterized protein BP5553_07231 [Venustampulla echinocandica]|uniref:Uncharacterized protein n=1 Tax=Venustampulla echinocandica TaxID=2656787 RepID=A0A370TIY0_9HELO|nr:uncharacterized protein BP5553_07231 [Venustampulla echinocandica]RDL35300.1 hypothetical protein BP5553_07231 [Venustampulla echinocandica]